MGAWMRVGGRSRRRGVAAGLLAAFSFSLIPTTASADGATQIAWTPLASAPVKRTEAGSAVVDGTVFLFGGYSTGFDPIRRVDAYDIATNTWARRPDMPEGITHMGVATDGTYAYIAGGYLAKVPKGQLLASDHVWRFDPVANTFTAMPPLPSPRGGGALVLLGRVLHYYGGSNLKGRSAGNHWTLALDTDTVWQSAAAMPNPRNHIGGAALDGVIYAVGGQHGQNDAAIAQDEVDAWSPVTNSWTTVAPLPAARSHVNGSTLAFQGRLVVAGGDPTPNRPTAEVDAYDPATGQWATLTPLPHAVYTGVLADLGPAVMSTTGGMPTKTNLTYQGTFGE